MNVSLFAVKPVEHWQAMRPLLNGAGKRSSPVAPFFRKLVVCVALFGVSCSVVSPKQDVLVSPSLYDAETLSLKGVISTDLSASAGILLSPSSVKREKNLRMLAVLCISKRKTAKTKAKMLRDVEE
jgi:hypothetical protein